MTKLVMRGGEPAHVGLDAHEAADVVVEVDVPGTRVRVLLAAGRGVGRVEVRLDVERRGQGGEAKRDVERLRLAGDELGRLAPERAVGVNPLDQSGPVLAPAVGQPVRRDRAIGGGHAVALGQGVLGPGVQLLVERPSLGNHVVAEGDHLVDGQAVVGHLKREERVEADLAGHLVAEVAELEQPRAERPTDRLGRLPHGEAFGRVA